MSLKRLITIFLVYCLLISLSFVFGYVKGKKQAFEDIISEKCWLSKDGALDIECTVYVAK